MKFRKTAVAVAAALALGGAPVSPVAAQGPGAVEPGTEISPAAMDDYINMDIDAARAQDPQLFDKNMRALNESDRLDDFLDNNSVDPAGEKQRLAAIGSDEGIREFVDSLDSGYQERGGGDSTRVSTKANCWKSWVGIGAYTMVTGAACGATGPVVGTACVIGAAGAGDNINWDRYC
ncbi:hypothetical protein [Corynebacterium kalidii]